MLKPLKRVELLKLLKTKGIGKWSQIFKLKKVDLQKIALEAGLIDKEGCLVSEVKSELEPTDQTEVKPKQEQKQEQKQEVKQPVSKTEKKRTISVTRQLGKQNKLHLTAFGSSSEDEEDQPMYKERNQNKTKQTVKKYEKEIREILRDYIDEVKNTLSVYDRKRLDQYDAQDIFQSYNELTDDLENLVNDISDECQLSTGESFSDRFLDGIERKIYLQKGKVENFVK
jgi:hypothetical protein